jgi:geranylgeranyl reductase family protein
MYDVIIVGSGPAGSTAAFHCAKAGLKTLVIEKDKLGRNKPCGGGVGLWTQDFSEFEGIIKRKVPCVNYLYNYDSIASNKRNFVLFDRREFDMFLAKKAKKAGANIKENEKFLSMQLQKDRITVKTDKHTYESKLLIGADGVYSDVAKAAGLMHKRTLYASLVIEDAYPNDKIKEFFKGEPSLNIYFFSKFLGYYWVFPKDNTLNVGNGLFCSDSLDLKQGLVDFMKHLNIPFSEDRIRGMMIPVELLKKIYSERLILVGDAAGFVGANSCGGIELAMMSGEKAAVIAKKAVDAKDFSERFLSGYMSECSELFKHLEEEKSDFNKTQFLIKSGFISLIKWRWFRWILSKIYELKKRVQPKD